jgi:hypothetical protein
MGNLLEMRECSSLFKTMSEGATVFSIKQPIAAHPPDTNACNRELSSAICGVEGAGLHGGGARGGAAEGRGRAGERRWIVFR